ncbi:hypothetical protein QQF64_017873 [Cirrhinus molitorella]|uniref:Uncharacterized protein n=1 Tax=Cirrhinus molitorella TaxID=172907 RepID=A0ABR3LLH0_9TELE
MSVALKRGRRWESWSILSEPLISWRFSPQRRCGESHLVLRESKMEWLEIPGAGRSHPNPYLRSLPNSPDMENFTLSHVPIQVGKCFPGKGHRGSLFCQKINF